MASLILLIASLLSIVAAQILSLHPAPIPTNGLIQRRRSAQYPSAPPQTHLPDGDSDPLEELELLDIVLLASVDGKFHALNRTSGHILWSMASYSTLSSESLPSALAPLVRTHHVEYDPEITDEGAHQEVYIIEPQSGDIYVMTNPSSPMQRFPFKMQELVDMSPFSFEGDEDRRVFVGKKETSLLIVELETGKIKATLNSECPWDQIDDYKDDSEEIDLDELEGSKPQKQPPTEVYIGRTDYHVSIFTRPTKGDSPYHKPQVQNLSFSIYGPNKQDNHLQSQYLQTKDNTYIQSLPNEEVMSIKTKRSVGSTQPSFEPVWGQPSFTQPIVAVFDVLKRTSDGHIRPHPFVLLQPRPRIQDLIPNIMTHLKKNKLSAYVGLVEETGSLYAMSPDHFPLVAFGNSGKKYNSRMIDGGRDQPITVDDFTRQRKQEELLEQELDCHARIMNDRRCLVGAHKLEVDDGDGHETRMKRLLDAPEAGANKMGAYQPMDSGVPAPTVSSPPLTIDPPKLDPGPGVSSTKLWEAFGISLVLGALSVWFFVRRGSGLSMGVSDTRNLVESDLAKATVPPVIPAPPKPETPRFTDKELPAVPVSLPDTAPSLEVVSVKDKDGEDSDREEGEVHDAGDVEATPAKKRTRRGKRGAKKKNVAIVDGDEGYGKSENGIVSNGKSNGSANGKEKKGKTEVNQNSALEIAAPTSSSSLVVTSTPKAIVAPSLLVSDTILGYGSHGTVVFQGSLQGRAVAVKRLLQDFVTLASREVSILQESDDHPNVIRYYYQEAHAGFLYIALELCPASLADLIETPDRDQWRDIAVSFDPKRALRQVTSGLRHLHALKLVHRDIKPQNILVSTSKTSSGGGTGAAGKGSKYRMLISDFGLCKKLDVDQTSFLPTAHGAMAAGTVGWRAPEILRGEVKLDELTDNSSVSSRGSVATINGNSSTHSNASNSDGKKGGTRLTKSVDIFALGCLYYYTLTGGGHPFGDRYEREVNIMKNAKNLELLERFGEEGIEAADLISKMLDPTPSGRPDTLSCLLHPFFWDSGRRLNFLQDASDRFEIMCREPRDARLVTLEDGSSGIVGNDWYSRLDRVFIENLGKFRKYDGKSVQDLLRALRNKKHHYQDLPDNVKRHLGAMPEGYLGYFTRRFPKLFLHVHGVVQETALQEESMFKAYFELPDS